MKVQLSTSSDFQQFTCTNESGHTITLGQGGNAVGPMESVLMAIAGCSTIDIEMILKKMRQPVEHIQVEVEAKRREESPRTFTEVHLNYILKGDLKESKVAQAIDSSLEKYCSVSKMIDKSAEISSTFEII